MIEFIKLVNNIRLLKLDTQNVGVHLSDKLSTEEMTKERAEEVIEERTQEQPDERTEKSMRNERKNKGRKRLIKGEKQIRKSR